MGLAFSATQGWYTEMNLLAGNCERFRVDRAVINCSTLCLEKVADPVS
jgi:hypothetical protein